MSTWYVVSRIETIPEGTPTLLVRVWEADDYEHAMEQHMDAFPDEECVCACYTEPMFYGSVRA